MYVCIYVCMYVRTYVCMYVRIDVMPLFVIPALQKKTTLNRKTKTQEFNKQKKTDCTPQGEGSSGRELGLVVLFLVLFSHCQWLHSSDIAIADVTSRNCQCMCKRTVKKLHSEGVPFYMIFF